MLLLTLPVAPMKLITRNFTAAVFKHINSPHRWFVNQVSTPTSVVCTHAAAAEMQLPNTNVRHFRTEGPRQSRSKISRMKISARYQEDCSWTMESFTIASSSYFSRESIIAALCQIMMDTKPMLLMRRLRSHLLLISLVAFCSGFAWTDLSLRRSITSNDLRR